MNNIGVLLYFSTETPPPSSKQKQITFVNNSIVNKQNNIQLDFFEIGRRKNIGQHRLFVST